MWAWFLLQAKAVYQQNQDLLVQNTSQTRTMIIISTPTNSAEAPSPPAWTASSWWCGLPSCLSSACSPQSSHVNFKDKISHHSLAQILTQPFTWSQMHPFAYPLDCLPRCPVVLTPIRCPHPPGVLFFPLNMPVWRPLYQASSLSQAAPCRLLRSCL